MKGMTLDFGRGTENKRVLLEKLAFRKSIKNNAQKGLSKIVPRG